MPWCLAYRLNRPSIWLARATREQLEFLTDYYRSDDKYFVIYTIAVVKFTLSELVWRKIPSVRDPTFLDTEVNFCNKKIKGFSITPEHVFFFYYGLFRNSRSIWGFTKGLTKKLFISSVTGKVYPMRIPGRV